MTLGCSPGKAALMQMKASRTGPSFAMLFGGQPRWMARKYEQFVKETYMMNAVSYRCVRYIAESAAQMPLASTEQFEALLRSPSKTESRYEFLVSLYSYLLVAGQAFVELVELDGEPRELFLLRPDRMKVKYGKKGYPERYIYEVSSAEKVNYVLKPEGEQQPILHVKEFHPLESWQGLSPIEPAGHSIDVHNESNAFIKALLQNSARPSGALVYAGGADGTESLSPEQFARLREELEDRYSGASNAGRPMLLEGGLDWKQISITPEDLQYSEAKQQSARDIALAFGVPPQLLGIGGDNTYTYTNYEQAIRAMYRQTVIPLVKHVAQDFSQFLAPTYGPEFSVETNLDELPALAEERKQLWDRVNAADFLTPNEKREAVGYEPIEGGDQLRQEREDAPEEETDQD